MINEFLSRCTQIPYNSCYPDLPEGYKEDLRWGLDCFGFINLMSGEFPSTTMITGLYRSGLVHSAAILDGQYVDPFLRMTGPMDISDQKTEVITYYQGSSVIGQLTHDTIFNVELKRGLFNLENYRFDLQNNIVCGQQDHQRRFTILHNSRPLIVEKKKTRGGVVQVDVRGENPQNAETILQANLGIGLRDVAQMFRDADENAAYLRALARS